MTQHTTREEDRLMSEAENLGEVIPGLLEIIERLDGELEEANEIIAELKNKVEKLTAV